MAKHIILLGPVDHDGKIYNDGDALDAPAAAVAALVALGVIELAGKKPEPPAEPPAQQTV